MGAPVHVVEGGGVGTPALAVGLAESLPWRRGFVERPSASRTSANCLARGRGTPARWKRRVTPAYSRSDAESASFVLDLDVEIRWAWEPPISFHDGIPRFEAEANRACARQSESRGDRRELIPGVPIVEEVVSGRRGRVQRVHVPVARLVRVKFPAVTFFERAARRFGRPLEEVVLELEHEELAPASSLGRVLVMAVLATEADPSSLCPQDLPADDVLVGRQVTRLPLRAPAERGLCEAAAPSASRSLLPPHHRESSPATDRRVRSSCPSLGLSPKPPQFCDVMTARNPRAPIWRSSIFSWRCAKSASHRWRAQPS